MYAHSTDVCTAVCISIYSTIYRTQVRTFEGVLMRISLALSIAEVFESCVGFFETKLGNLNTAPTAAAPNGNIVHTLVHTVVYILVHTHRYIH